MVQSNHSTALPTLPATMVRTRETGTGSTPVGALGRREGVLMNSSICLFLVKTGLKSLFFSN